MHRSPFGRFTSDTRHAARGLIRRPAFSITAVLSIALGLGATVTVFSVLNALLLKPLPYREPQRLVAIWPAQAFANREIEAFRQRTRSYESVGSLSPGWLMALTNVVTPRQLNGARVSGNLFEMLGVAPVLGRAFGMEAEISGNDAVALLSWELWQTTFGGDPAVIGRSIRLDRVPITVIGVMPRNFQPLGVTSDLWTPMTMDQTAMAWAGAVTLAYGRLREGVSPQTARDELRALASQLQREFDLPPNWTQGVDVVRLQESMVGATRPTLFTLFAAVAFLLLIAAANVANLLLVRNSERRHELAVRASLGATPRDLAGFLGTESLLIGSVGGLVGVGFAYAGVALLRRILPSGLPRLGEISVNGTVIVAAAVFSLATAVLFGLAPTLQGRAAALMERMRAGRTVAGQGARTRGAMVAIEVALALVLTIGATLMGRTLIALNHVDAGLRTDHLLTMKVQPSTGADDELRAFWNTTLERIRGLPGVTSAATLLHLPTGGRKWMGPVTVEGRALAAGQSPKRTAWQAISPDYFRTVGIPLLKGRGLADTDGPSVSRVIAVNSVFAEQNFPGEDPIGKRVKAGNGTQNDWATIVGVVGSVRHDSLNVPAGPEVYVPFAQRTVVATALIVRTSGNPLLLSAPIRDAIWSVDRNVPITDVRTMDDLFSASLSRQRMVLILLGLFAGMGLVLSAVGIYGVVAYGVRQRLREIGIRVALGADKRNIERLVLRQGMGYAAIGVVAGLPVAFGLSRLLRAMVFGIEVTDPLSFAVVPLLLVGVALAASWLPARRAAGGDPAEVLRD